MSLRWYPVVDNCLRFKFFLNSASAANCLLKKRYFALISRSSQNAQSSKNFGIVFDIDGVLLRGISVISAAKEALQLLVNAQKNEFLVPCVFCTNGFGLPNKKAEVLSHLLSIAIQPKQMVMSQTPLRNFIEFHNKWCLVSGPDHTGGASKVAESVGFNKIITIDDVRNTFPYLDWVDHSRWTSQDVQDSKNFPPVETILLLGEPIRWETNLQLITDMLLTKGRPNQAHTYGDTQIPVIAVNSDLQWMAKANSPRFGHGAFLLCLENLYKKLSGRDLKYTALVGKPSEITYQYAYNLINDLSSELQLPKVERIYMIGDNPLTDIYGANLFNRSLKNKYSAESTEESSRIRYISMLVCTGVFKPNSLLRNANHSVEDLPNFVTKSFEFGKRHVDHGHRDTPFCVELTKPDHVVNDVKEAIHKIFELENCT